MNTLKAYGCFLVFGGYGVYVATGGTLTPDPNCIGRCYGNKMAELIEDVGHMPVAGLFFVCAIFGFFYWRARA